MSETALKLPTKIDRLKAAAETEWKSLGQALLTEQQAGVHARMHRQELGEALIKLRKEVERQPTNRPSTGGRPKSIWWEWFEQWQPSKARGSIDRREAEIAMQIAGAEDADEAEGAYKARKNAANAKSRRGTFAGIGSSDTRESQPPVSLAVRQIEGMIRKLSVEDREALFARIGDLLP